MKIFDKIYNQIFGSNSTPEYNGKKYLVQEMYQLSQRENQDYLIWKGEKNTKPLLNSIFAGLQHKKAGLSENNQRFSIYESPQSNGFYILCEDFLDIKESQFFLEFIKDQVADLGYIKNHSSKEIFEESGNVKTKFTYYLKPKPENYELPLDQKFGNIHLECLFINDQPDYIKLLANIYSDRNYKNADSFDDLLIRITPN